MHARVLLCLSALRAPPHSLRLLRTAPLPRMQVAYRDAPEARLFEDENKL